MDNHEVIKLDCRGMVCPQPVVETRKAIMSQGEDVTEAVITIILDNTAACANVTRFAESLDFKVAQTNSGDGEFILTATRGFSGPVPESFEQNLAEDPGAEYHIYLKSQFMGLGDEKLGRILMKAFLKTLLELDNLPTTIIFVNSAVYLVTAVSGELNTIKSLEKAGCNLLVCGTCLDYYNLQEQLAVGQVSNMFEIANLLCGSERVVTP